MTTRPVRLAALILATSLVSLPAPASAGGSASPGPITRPLAGGTGPAGATAPVDDASRALATRMRAVPASPDTLQATIAALARSGIGTYADPGDAQPEMPVSAASPVRVLDLQAAGFAAGVWSGDGYLGSELDDVIPLPHRLLATSPTAADLLAGYVAAAATPGAALARALMSDQDLRAPRRVRFPAIVLELFVSDLTVSGTGAAMHPDGTAPARAVIALGLDVQGLCDQAGAFMDGVVRDVFAAIRLATPKDLPSAFLVGVWNWLVSQGEAIVSKITSTISDAVLGTIRSVAGVIAVVATEVSAFLPTSVRIDPTPGPIVRLAQDRPVDGAFVLQASTGGLTDWPPVITACAGAAGITLPDLAPHDLPVIWQGVTSTSGGGSWITATASNDRTDASGSASWAFSAVPDPGPPDGEERGFLDTITATVQRPGFDSLAARLQAIIFRNVPTLLQGFVARVLQPLTSGLEARTRSLFRSRGSGSVEILYHEPPEPTPGPGGSPQPSAAPGPTPRSGVPDPCSLLHEYEVYAALGHDVSAAHGRSTIGDYQGVACIFQDVPPDPRATTAHVRLDVYDLGRGAAGTFRAFEQGSGLASGQLHGLGDEGFYAADPDGGGILYVRSGRYGLALSVIATPGGLAIGKRLMRLVLGRI